MDADLPQRVWLNFGRNGWIWHFRPGKFLKIQCCRNSGELLLWHEMQKFPGRGRGRRGPKRQRTNGSVFSQRLQVTRELCFFAFSTKRYVFSFDFLCTWEGNVQNTKIDTFSQDLKKIWTTRRCPDIFVGKPLVECVGSTELVEVLIPCQEDMEFDLFG